MEKVVRRNSPRSGVRMRSPLEIAIYDGAVQAWKEAHEIKGNPLEWYAENRVFLGYKTFLRRLANGDWTLEELTRINSDMKNPKLTETILSLFKREEGV